MMDAIPQRYYRTVEEVEQAILEDLRNGVLGPELQLQELQQRRPEEALMKRVARLEAWVSFLQTEIDALKAAAPEREQTFSAKF
jgi:hypothetical protein